jgi:ketosteroid isomerase-like protein
VIHERRASECGGLSEGRRCVSREGPLGDPALADEDVVWHVPGDHQGAGDIRGRDALLAWLTDLAEVGFVLREHDVFGNDEHVCPPATWVVSIFHFRDGRQAEHRFYLEDLVAWDRIFDTGGS